MKKVLSLLLALVMILSLAPSAFAVKEFDYQTAFGSKDGFSYDKFTKTWSYYEAFVKPYTDAYVIIGITIWGEDGGPNPDYTNLYVKVLDEKGNNDNSWTIKGLTLSIDDTLYSYKSMYEGDTSSSVVLGEKGQKLINAIANCDYHNVSAQLDTNRGTITFGLDSTELKTTLYWFCQDYIKKGVWDFSVGTSIAEASEALYPLYIDGKLA